MKRITAALWGAPAVLAMVLAGCGSDGSGGGSTPKTIANGSAALRHDPSAPDYVGKILLRDAAGNTITKNDAKPYNAAQTCGSTSCHGKDAGDGTGRTQWEKMTLAYHFSMGRTGKTGLLQISDNYSNKPWVMSDGMYGKW